MRRLHFATLLLTIISLTASGCRQTTGPTSAGPLTPIGPLAPLGAGQSPTLGPFGGPTRVTPPSTGSYVAPNNYMGGVVPIDQANAGFAPSGALGPQTTGGVVGSGVQVATWSETNSVASAPDSTVRINSSASNDPRGGGMQVIDLTRAPPPPGYRGQAPSFNNQFPAAVPSDPNWSTGWQNQSIQSQPFQNQPFQNRAGLRAISTPNAAEIAGGLTPLPSVSREYPINPSPQEPSFPRTATGPLPGPSTEPVNSGDFNGSQPDLPWRRPGTRY